MMGGFTLAHGWLFAYAGLFVGGLLTTLTPCVFPLIPITVSIFGARQATRKRDAMLLSGSYVLGIALTYTALGVAAAATGSVFGRVMANPWVIGTIAVVFVVFAASMFGAFEIALPASLQTRLTQVGGKGFAGAFAMGLVAGIIAAPCTGPVLGTVLTYVATTQRLALGGTLLFSYALGMGLPFFIVGTFAVALPKSGAWMESVKSGFGILMLGLALYFLKDVVPVLKEHVDSTRAFRVGAVVAIAAGLIAGAIHLSFHGGVVTRVRKALGIALVTAGGFALVVSLTRSPLPSYSVEQWKTTGAALLAKARSEGKPVVIDFGADWCAACKELELRTYPHPSVAEELKRRFVFVKIDDARGALAKQYGAPGLPYVVFFDSHGEQLTNRNFSGYRSPGELLDTLRSIN